MDIGGELLIVNGNAQDLRGLGQLFSSVGLLVTPVADTVAARQVVETKYFPVILIDAAAGPEGASEFIKWVRSTSPTTEVVVTTEDPSFDLAAAFFRIGACDVVPKRREQVDYLKQRVLEAGRNQKLANESVTLLMETQRVLEDFLNVLMEVGRKNIELSGGDVSPVSLSYEVCLVDPEDLLASDLAKLQPDFVVSHCLSNGEALDKVATGAFNLLVAPLESDLPGRMVARTALKSRLDMDAWLYSGKPGAGEIIPIEVDGSDGRRSNFPDVRALAQGILKRKQRAVALARERRSLEVLKQQNGSIIRRYGTLREKIDAAIKAASND